MTKLPNKVKIGPHTYNVYHELELRNKDDVPLAGEHDRNYMTLKIYARQADNGKQETLLHEIMHAVMDNIDYKPGVAEENLVARLSVALLALIKENPKVVEYLRS